MATTVQSEEVSLVDTAVGPISVRTAVFSGYDIEDFVHDMVMSQGVQLRVFNAAGNADQRYTGDRLPVNIGGLEVGGFTGV